VSELKAVVIVCSDGVVAGTREDRSGPLARELLKEAGFVVAGVEAVPDDRREIQVALERWVELGVNLVVTSGGTGFGPRDVTPEATLKVVERQAPGMAEAVRAASPEPYGMLSRAVAGVAGVTVVVNLAGSVGGVRDGITALRSGLMHACELARGDGSEHPEPHRGTASNREHL